MDGHMRVVSENTYRKTKTTASTGNGLYDTYEPKAVLFGSTVLTSIRAVFI